MSPSDPTPNTSQMPPQITMLLKHIIHDWDDERAIAILQRCHQAMEEQGRVH
jgi:hypothetical protein